MKPKSIKDTPFGKILQGLALEKKDQEEIEKMIQKELSEKPFKVAVIGQSGVGKSSTLKAVFDLDFKVSDIAEGTKEVREKTTEVAKDVKLSVFDMPGLNVNIEKDKEYEKLYREILPDCDVIVYVIDSSIRNIGEDCRILRDIVLPICEEKSITNNMILALNKIDIIGQAEDYDDPELQWDWITNLPTEKLKDKIKLRLDQLNRSLVANNLVGESGLKPEQVVYFSAACNFNLSSFVKAILNTPKGFIWIGTYGFDRIGRFSDIVNERTNK